MAPDVKFVLLFVLVSISIANCYGRVDWKAKRVSLDYSDVYDDGIVDEIFGPRQGSYSQQQSSAFDDMPVVDLLGGGNLEGDYPSQERQQRVLRPTNGCPSDNDKNRRIVNLEERASKTPTIQSDEGYQEVKKIEIVKDPALREECSFYTESHGYECVPYYQCDEDGAILTDGAGLIDIRFGGGQGYGDDDVSHAELDATDKKCPGSLDVCCQDPDWTPPPVVKEEELRDTTTTTTTTTTSTTTTTTTPRPYAPQCGQHNAWGLGVRISGYADGESQFGEWPHMCAILTMKKIGRNWINMYTCGGSLIAPGAVLTAAHCAKKLDPATTKIRCGEWDTQSTKEPFDYVDRNASRIFSHPTFNPKNLKDDFAVILTDGDFELSKHIDTVCLPQMDEEFNGERCWATGWGKDTFGQEGKYQVILKEIDLPIVPFKECQANLRKTRLGRRFKLDKSFVCAGGEEGKDACKGDGGGPLVCPKKDDPGRVVQAGIVAWGIGCGQKDVPGVYANVASEVCWIDCILTQEYGNEAVSYLGLDSKCNEWQEKNAGARRLPWAVKKQFQKCANIWPRDMY